MRKTTLLAGVVALGLAASSASANFIVTSDRTQVGSNDVIRWFAQNDGQNGTGTKLLAVSVTVSSLDTNLAFKIADADGDGVDDADVNFRGTPSGAPSATTIANSGGSYVRFGSPSSFLIGGNLPEGYSDANGDGTTDPGGELRATYFQNAKTFRVDGFNGSGGIVTTNPIQFAAAVVPHNTPANTVIAEGTLAGDQGNAQPFSAPNPIPEPATFGLLGVTAVGLLSRRRRQA